MSHPPAPVAGWRRAARAAGLGGASLGLGVTAHAAGGGVLPHAPGLVVLTVPVLLAAVLLTGRRLRLPAIVAVLGLEQWGLHQALGLLSPSVGSDCAVVGPAHHVGAMVCAGPAAAPDPMSHAGSGWLMLLTHAVATLVVAVVLARGEAALWRVTARLRRAWSLLHEPVVLGGSGPSAPSGRLRVVVSRYAGGGPAARAPPAYPSMRA